MKNMRVFALCAGLALAMSPAFAQQQAPAQVQSIGPTDLFQDVVNGSPTPQNFYAPAALLGNYSASLAGNNPENFLIGGDAGTNLWQRGTTGSSVTTTTTYGGPDRWAYWSGTSTAMTVSRSSTAGDLPATYQYAFKMARTAAQTGVVQMCMVQVVESANSYGFRGQTAEIDFHAVTGSTFSGTGVTAYLLSGTGSDEGSAKAAYGINAGGGGGAAWTGQVSTGVAVAMGASQAGRYTVAIPVPSTATEIAVALCFTPVGTAGAADYVAFSGIQLTRNSALTTLAGTAGIALSPNDTRAKAFARRLQQTETALQQRFFYRLAEPASGAAINGMCQAVGATSNICNVNLPVPMRSATPTIAITTAGTFKVNLAGTPTTITSPTASTCGVQSCAVTAGNTNTAGQAELLTGGGGSGAWDITAEL